MTKNGRLLAIYITSLGQAIWHTIRPNFFYRPFATPPAVIVWNKSSTKKENNMAFLTKRTTTKPKGRLLWRGG